MVTREDYLVYKLYCQNITEAPRPMSAQWNEKSGMHLWCQDWQQIEICKCLFHGEETYLGDPPPRRLKGNPFYKPKEIVEITRELLRNHKSAEEVVSYLRNQRLGGVNASC